MVGGILTIICAVILFTYAIVIMVPIFNKDNYNLDIKPQQIQAFFWDKNESTGEFYHPHFLPCGDSRNCVRYSLQDLLVPLFNNSVIFVEYPINKFQSYDCSNVTISLRYYDDEDHPSLIYQFNSSFFSKRDFDQVCYFRLSGSIKYIPQELLNNQLAVYQMTRLEYRLRLNILIEGLQKDVLVYR